MDYFDWKRSFIYWCIGLGLFTLFVIGYSIFYPNSLSKTMWIILYVIILTWNYGKIKYMIRILKGEKLKFEQEVVEAL